MRDFRNAVFLWIMTGVQLLHFVVCACITATLCSQLSQRVEAKENEKEGNDVAGENPLEGGKDDTKKPEAPKAPSLFSFVMALTGAVWDKVGHGTCAQRYFSLGHFGAMFEKGLDPLAPTFSMGLLMPFASASLSQHGGASGRTLYLRFLPRGAL